MPDDGRQLSLPESFNQQREEGVLGDIVEEIDSFAAEVQELTPDDLSGPRLSESEAESPQVKGWAEHVEHPRGEYVVMTENSRVPDDAVDTLRHVAETGDFADSAVDIDTEPPGDLGPWTHPNIPMFQSPGGKYAAIDVRTPVEDFKRLQQYIGRQLGPGNISRKEWWSSAYRPTVQRVERSLERGVVGEIPMPYVVVGPDGYLHGTQEGRSRVLGAEAAGVETIPFRLVVHAFRSGVRAPE